MEFEVDDAGSDAEARRLLRAAFEAARDSGKLDWRRMTAAVLKNRLLQLSDGQFSEQSFGADSLSDFLARFSDVIRVDSSSKPAVVELVEGPTPAGASVTGRGDRVRRDLWNAVIDYASGRVYYWDAEHGRALAADPSDRPSGPLLPTVDREEISTWRAAFAALQAPTLPEEAVADLDLWAERGLGTGALPPSLRNEWNLYQRERVIDRLRTWFTTTGIDIPTDLVQHLPREEAQPRDSDLRDLIRRCIDVMTHDELAQLSIPVRVVARIARS